jgi:outer membrane receptor protein involved in Fe transport
MKFSGILLAGTAIAFGTAPALAQAAGASPQADAQSDAAETQDIIVTGVARGRDRLDSSVSTSSLSAASLVELAPRSSAELLRNLPGIRVEASGGEGNANISVRGLPVASGGSKFLQLQEDGLPILEFGDITFGNADIFLRTDFNVGRIESVRGGSASTFASNSPGGIINFLSKTGEQEGSAIQFSGGIDYREYRTDVDYGGRLSDTVRYHFGGFYRLGDGPRKVGYDAMRGGQIKANITKELAGGGYIRFYGKYLDDRGIAYLPNPVRVTGSDGDPDYASLPGFSINNATLHSRNIQSVLTLDGKNNRTTRDISDGQHPVVKAVGFEAELPLFAGFSVTERFRYADISGNFISPFPSSVDDAQSVANSIGGAGAQLFYASGPLSGQRIANPGTINGNGLLANIVLFDVDLNKLDNITNDIRINGSIPFANGSLSVTAGFYKSRQYINTDWLWTSFVQDVAGNGNSALVDVRTAAGVPVTEGGVYGYSARFFGDCCRRSYDLRYDTDAPFAQLGFELGRLNVDGSLRYDFGRARGSIAGSDVAGVGITALDINGDGVISAPEQSVAVIPAVRSPVRYNYDYLSYSFGVNYRLLDALAAFGRYSRGGRANADRLTFGPAINATTGRLIDSGAAIDFVRQAELGLKYRDGPLAVSVTGFHARTEEQNFEATTQRFFNRNYQATGVELEGAYRIGGFSLTAGGTYTDAKIKKDVLNPAVEGNRPRRQAKFIYQITPQYETGLFTVGANVIGTTDSYTQDSNQLKLPAYTQVNAFLAVRPFERVTVSVNANNVFDVKGFTEAEDATIPANGIVRARSINGRTVSGSVRFDF